LEPGDFDPTYSLTYNTTEYHSSNHQIGYIRIAWCYWFSAINIYVWMLW